MSDITDGVTAEHPLLEVDECLCGATSEGNGWRTRHLAEVTEAATRAQIAADIRDAVGAVSDYILWYEDHDARVWAETPQEAAEDILNRLASIAEGSDR